MIELRHGRVVHAVPGRLRVKLEPGELSGESAEQLQSALLGMPGVEDVRVNRVSRSIVIRYDRERLDVGRLLELAQAAELLALDAPAGDPYAGQAVPLSETGARIKRVFHQADARLSEMTNRRWDLRTVVPLAFGALALRQIVRELGSLQAVPWYVLAWYAFDSFWKLNQEGPLGSPAPERPALDAAEEPR